MASDKGASNLDYLIAQIKGGALRSMALELYATGGKVNWPVFLNLKEIVENGVKDEYSENVTEIFEATLKELVSDDILRENPEGNYIVRSLGINLNPGNSSNKLYFKKQEDTDAYMTAVVERLNEKDSKNPSENVSEKIKDMKIVKIESSKGVS